jgi:hypothetical protein
LRERERRSERRKKDRGVLAIGETLVVVCGQRGLAWLLWDKMWGGTSLEWAGYSTIESRQILLTNRRLNKLN